MLETLNRRTGRISLILLAFLVSVGAGDLALAHAPTLDEMTPKGFLAWQSQRIELGSSLGPEYFARTLEQYKGRARLNRMQYIISNYYDNSPASDRQFNKWNKSIRDYATAIHDQRYIDVANLNKEFKRFYAGNIDNQGVLSFSTPKYDWYVRSLALSMVADDQKDSKKSLYYLTTAHKLIDITDPTSNLTLYYYWYNLGTTLFKLGNIDGGAEAQAIADIEYLPEGLQIADTIGLLNLTNAAIETGDEDVARRALTVVKSASVRSRNPTDRANAAAICTYLEANFGEPQAVLNCLNDVTIKDMDPVYLQVSAVNFRAAAEAALGLWEKAASDLSFLVKINSSHQFSAGVTANIPFVEAQILFHEGRANEGRQKLEAFYQNRWRRFQHIYGNALHQMTDVLRQENKNLTIEDFQQKEQIKLKNYLIFATCSAVLLFAAILFVLTIFYRRALSEKRRADEANSSKMQFLAEVSHEVRTPLNGVLGLIQAMERDDLSPTQRERLKIVKGSSKTMLTILNDLLDLAKIDSGKFNLEMIEFDLRDVIQGVESAFWAQAKAKNIAFCVDADQDALGVYRADPTRLRQIIDNLVSNAIKFTEAGSVTVKVKRPDGALVIEVRDTGIGMDAEAAGRVFKRFEQADVATARRFGGTGLGLSICQNLVSAFGGDIQISSELGVGTRFIATLPIEKVEAPTESRLDLAFESTQPKSPDPDLTILAAEDHPINRLVLRTLLNQFGADVEIVENGVQAVEQFRRGGWGIVFLDISMPEMDGVEAVKAMRAVEAASGWKRVPIFALTANAMATQVDDYLKAGFDGHLSKPIEAQALLDALMTASPVSCEGELSPTF